MLVLDLFLIGLVARQFAGVVQGSGRTAFAKLVDAAVDHRAPQPSVEARGREPALAVGQHAREHVLGNVLGQVQGPGLAREISHQSRAALRVDRQDFRPTK